MITVELKEEKLSVMVQREREPDEISDNIVCAILSVLIFAYAVSMKSKHHSIKTLGNSKGCGIEPEYPDSRSISDLYDTFWLMYIGIRFVTLIFPDNVKIRYEE